MSSLVDQLEKLAQLYKSGLLTEVELEAAKLRAIEASESRPALAEDGGSTCPNCGSKQHVGKPHCSDCGASLLRRCGFCAAENEFSSKHCAECGSDLSKSPTPGLALPRARDWRETFQALGWWDNPNDSVWPKIASLAAQLPRLNLPPNLDGLDNYWTFCCRVRKRDYGIREVRVNNKIATGEWAQEPVQYLVGTRQSIVFFNLNRPEAVVGRFADLTTFRFTVDEVRLQFRNVLLEFKMSIKRPTIGAILAMTRILDPSTIGVGYCIDYQRQEQRAKKEQSFEELLRAYMRDIIAVAGLQWRA